MSGENDFARPLVDESNIPFAHVDQVRSGPLNGVSLWRRLNSIVQSSIGTIQAWRLIGKHKPQALLLTGGWVGLPIALAARLRGVPALIYLPDIEPGLAIKRLTPLAHKVAATTQESRRYFPHGKVVVTGYPIRESIRSATREAGIAHFQLDLHKETLLVFGGSRGARSINTAILDILPELLADGLQIIHVTGTLDWEEIEKRRSDLSQKHELAHYHAFPYLHDDMGMAMAAADLAICRSGASTLGELPLFGLPAILVPYPYAWRYQKVNADWLAERGAAVVIADETMKTDLLMTIRNLRNDATRLNSMKVAASALTQPEGAHSPDGASNLAREILNLVEAR